MKRTVFPVSMIVLIAGLALQACSQPAPAAETPAARAANTSAATAAPLPTIALPTTVPELSLGISGSGEVKAAQDADLVFIVQGTVAEVLVKDCLSLIHI